MTHVNVSEFLKEHSRATLIFSHRRYGGGCHVMIVTNLDLDEDLMVTLTSDYGYESVLHNAPWFPYVYGDNFDEVMQLLENKFSKLRELPTSSHLAWLEVVSTLQQGLADCDTGRFDYTFPRIDHMFP